MKTDKQITGQIGEDAATQYLLREDYTLLERNWRNGRAEIDIIARKAEVLVFIEVKTLRDLSHGAADKNINKNKLKMIWDAAAAYSAKINHDWAIRFDYIYIHLKEDNSYSISHLEDAYWPGDSGNIYC